MKEIKAISDSHAVLSKGQVQTIGYVTDKKRYTGRGCILPTQVAFHFGTANNDHFYFENDKLTYMSVNLNTPDYLCQVYANCAALQSTPQQFIDRVTSVYVFKELGF